MCATVLSLSLSCDFKSLKLLNINYLVGASKVMFSKLNSVIEVQCIKDYMQVDVVFH